MELTPASLKKLCKDLKLYSSAPELNDVLHLQHKGITKLESLEAYTGLKTLYLESNAIADIEGLDALINLRCLYLGKNMIHEIAGLDTLTQLESLDLSENDIRCVEGLATLPKLKFLSLAGNKLESLGDTQQLQHCQSLVTLDLSSNRLNDEEAVHLIMTLPLSLLKLNGNPVVSHMRSYRKTVVAGIPGLHHLDDMPVTAKERRLAVSFMQGGLEAERAERTAIMQEEEHHKEQQRQNFNNMVEAARAEAVQNPPAPHDPMRFRAVPPGESESDDEGAAAINNPEPSTQNASGAAEHTFTGGSSSTAQPFTDAGTSYDDIDTDPTVRMLGESADPGDSSAWHKHDISAADTTTPQLDSHNTDTQHTVDHSNRASHAHDAHTQNMTALSQQPVQADALPDHMPQQGTEGHASSSAAAAAATAASEAAVQVEGQEVGPPCIPGVGGPTLASNLAFQQELQQRSEERQARAGAVMSDASAREVADRGNRESEPAQRSLREQARPAVWGTPQYSDLWQRALSVGERQEAAQAENPLQADLILSAIYSGESAGADRDQPYPDRGRPEPAHVRGHQGMDIDSAAAHRIPRGDDSAAESDASSLSDYGISSDPMERFTVTALPMTDQFPSSSWHSPPQQLPQQLQYEYQQQQQQQQQDRSSLNAEQADDSAHNGRLMPELGSEQQTGMRPELAAMRGRADSAHEMPTSGSRPDLARGSGPFERTDSASDLPQDGTSGETNALCICCMDSNVGLRVNVQGYDRTGVVS
ncbi:TPA: hypothetical protein ACH3X2_012011 [Trebouxia sp. C0005]